MSDFNPYAAPQAKISTQDLDFDGEGLWQDGPLLRMRKGTELPDRCLACNEPAFGYRLKRTLSWHKPGWYLLIFFNLIIYVIVALCVRWTAKVSAPFCPVHRARRRNAIIFGWLGCLSGIVLFVFGAASESAAAILVGALLFLVSLVVGVARSQLLVPKKIDEHFVWLKKVSPDYLAALPDWR